MSKIQIAELNVTGTELFQGADSFLTELQPMEASAIYGGACGSQSGGKRSGGKRSGGCQMGKSSNKSSGATKGLHNVPPVVVPPVIAPSV